MNAQFEAMQVALSMTYQALSREEEALESDKLLEAVLEDVEKDDDRERREN